jgi:hypothetical protein
VEDIYTLGQSSQAGVSQNTETMLQVFHPTAVRIHVGGYVLLPSESSICKITDIILRSDYLQPFSPIEPVVSRKAASSDDKISAPTHPCGTTTVITVSTRHSGSILGTSGRCTSRIVLSEIPDEEVPPLGCMDAIVEVQAKEEDIAVKLGATRSISATEGNSKPAEQSPVNATVAADANAEARQLTVRKVMERLGMLPAAGSDSAGATDPKSPSKPIFVDMLNYGDFHDRPGAKWVGPKKENVAPTSTSTASLVKIKGAQLPLESSAPKSGDDRTPAPSVNRRKRRRSGDGKDDDASMKSKESRLSRLIVFRRRKIDNANL